MLFSAYRFVLLCSLSLFCTQNLFFAVALVKESCHLLDAGLDGPVMVRLLHQETNKYICFNKRGRIRTVVSLIFQKEILWLFSVSSSFPSPFSTNSC